MKKMKILLMALLVSGTALAQTNWTIDKAHSKIGFNVIHMAISEVEGEFRDFDAKVTSTADDFQNADVEFTAKVTSIDTENERRDNDLRSDNFFNAEKYPEIKFKGKLVKEGNAYKLKGDFTMLDAEETPVAGVCHARGSNAGLPAQWMIYIHVADLDASIASCRESGGEVLAGPKSFGVTSRYAVIRDPAGAVAALFQAG